MSVDTRLGRVVTYCERLQPFGHANSVGSRGNLKNLYLHLHHTYGH